MVNPRVALVVISVSDRIDSLNRLLDTIVEQGIQHDVCLFYQDDADNWRKIARQRRIAHAYFVPSRIGCHAARVSLLRQMPLYDAYVNLDDDVELTEHTDYAPAIEKALEPGSGFVLTNWARNRELLDAKVPRKRPVFVRQIMVYQGGGMAYGEDTAALMRSLPIQPATFDSAWPITAYVNGRINYRYLGSLSVHRILGQGGMKRYMRENPISLMCEDLLRYRPAAGGRHDVCIPLDGDVLPRAHDLHRAARTAAGWAISRTSPAPPPQSCQCTVG